MVIEALPAGLAVVHSQSIAHLRGVLGHGQTFFFAIIKDVQIITENTATAGHIFAIGDWFGKLKWYDRVAVIIFFICAT